MSLNLTNLLARLFRRSVPVPVRAPRLGLEPLEAREVPAVVVTVTKVSDATEGGANGLVRFTRDSALFSALTVNYTVGGTATQGADYGPLGGSVTFDIGVQSVDVALVPAADNVAEGDETALFVVVGGFGYEPGTDPDDRATVIIHDNPAVIAVTASDTSEGSATGGFSFTRSGGDLSFALTVTYSVGGTATAGTDYTALSGSVTFAAGADRVEVPVQAFGDNLADDGETVIATLTGAGSTYTIDSGASYATVTIADQPLTVSVMRLNDGEEGASNATFRFTRAGDLSTSLTVAYATAGTATAGTDYTALSGSVTFAANSDRTDVPVSVTDDVLVEPTETVTVTLVPNANYTFGNDSDTVFIRDNDTRRVYWVSSGSTDWNVGSNWSINSVPVATDDVYFSAPYSNVDVSALGSGRSSLAFAGVHFVDGYSGTVTLAVPFTVGTYEQTTGTLNQGVRVLEPGGPELPNDLTTTGAFLWTGGTLNTLDNGSQVVIDGAAGVIDAPGDTGLSLATASTLNVVGGSVVALLPGVLKFTGGAGMYIAGNADINAFTTKNLDVTLTKTAQSTASVNVAWDGNLAFKSTSGVVGTCVSDLPISNSGTMSLMQTVHLVVNGHAGGGTGPSLLQTNGVMKWWTGSNIVAQFGMSLYSGTLEFQVVKPKTLAKLAGNLTVGSSATTPTITFAGESGFGQFTVEGDTSWVSGTFTPRLDGDGSTNAARRSADSWKTTGSLTRGSGARIEPNFLPDDNNVKKNDTWDVLLARDFLGVDIPDPTSFEGHYGLYLYELGSIDVISIYRK